MNTCISCGAVIPEGRQICPNCFLRKEFHVPKEIKERKKEKENEQKVQN